jgi:hypothetical protein
MIYIGLWVVAICACAIAADVYPTMRKYFKGPNYVNKDQPRVKTTISIGNRRNK